MSSCVCTNGPLFDSTTGTCILCGRFPKLPPALVRLEHEKAQEAARRRKRLDGRLKRQLANETQRPSLF